MRRAAELLSSAGCATALADALALPNRSQDLKASALVAAILLSNAALLHHRMRLVPDESEAVSLKSALLESETAASAVREAWKAILSKGHHPVFEPALAALNALGDNRARELIRLIGENAVRDADELAGLRFDHAGSLYHRLLASSRFDGSFYTNNVSAVLLARLALTEDFVDWSNADAIADLKIIDPACGTGTLLMAAMHAIRDRHERAAGRQSDSDPLHLALVEDVLYGLDINRHGVQLAACNLTLANPRIDYRQMSLFTMRHGPQEDGVSKAGSLEFLATARDRRDIASLAAPLPSPDGLAAERAAPGTAPTESLAGLFDLVIMNPPFTRNDIRNRQYSKKDRRSLQRREMEIAEFVADRDPSGYRAISQTSVESFFTPLADVLARPSAGSIAVIVPTTALTGASSAPKRKFLAERFQIELIVTSHDPGQISFSENTAIHESLVVGRRPGPERHATRFVSLARMPRDTHEAILLSDRINRGARLGTWGTEHLWPWPRVRAGEWTAAQFFDGALANAIHDLAALAGTVLVPSGDLCRIEPEGRRVRDAFVRKAPVGARWTTPILWDHSTEVQTKMDAAPDVIGAPKPGRTEYAAYLRGKASRLLVVNRLRTDTVRVSACYVSEPVLGSAWIPVVPIVRDPAFEHALCAWWNSTPGILTFLNSRSKALDYARFSLHALRSLLVPDPNRVDVGPLAEAFAATRGKVLEPWPRMGDCAVRAALDQAAAQVLRIDGRTVADWRRRIAREPTVSGTPLSSTG